MLWKETVREGAGIELCGSQSQIYPNHSFPLLMEFSLHLCLQYFPWKLSLHHPVLCHLIALNILPADVPVSLLFVHFISCSQETVSPQSPLNDVKDFTLVSSINIVCFFYYGLLLESEELVKISESAAMPVTLDK